ncbi:unnamed protein product [Durusdinium trenchii]|uniref:Uncharacterized protein n=2 Tax=Durusdinium trenchii TaxID=1381693 RepID=A0ABP0S6Y6_9DINO
MAAAEGYEDHLARTFSTGDFLARLQRMDTCALCDASDKKARVITSVRPLKPGYHMVGRARTVEVDGDFLEVLVALREAQPGEVIMIDAGLRRGDEVWPQTGGLFGELLANEAQRRRLSGLVIDGNCRDTPLLRQMSLPIYHRGQHPNAGTAKKRGRSQVEIQMGGVSIQPGDFVLGDDDGLVVCSEEELSGWLHKAEETQELEGEILAHIQAGGSLFEKLKNLEEHLEDLKAGKPSTLKFRS